MAMAVISPTASSFWLWTLRPFNFEENISSFDTVENLASAGAVPTVLASSANTGLASMASDAAIVAIFFMSVLQCIWCMTMQDRAGCSSGSSYHYDAARCASSWSRDRNDFAESFGSSVAI